MQPNSALLDTVFRGLRTRITEQTIINENRMPLFTNLGPDFGSEDDSEGDDEDSENDGPEGQTRAQRDSPYLAQWHVLDIGYERSVLDVYDPVQDLPDTMFLKRLGYTYGNPEASWRRMLLCQPVLGPPRAERTINFKPKFNTYLQKIAPQFMPWQGSACGPWKGADFAAMAPYLYAGYVAVHGEALNRGTSNRRQVAMRLGWGLPNEPQCTVGERSGVNFMLNIPRGGLAVHMASIDLGWKGIKFQPTYPYHPERIDRVQFKLEGLHRFLDLRSREAYLIEYHKDPRDYGGYLYHPNRMADWPDVALWYSDLATPFELEDHLADMKSQRI